VPTLRPVGMGTDRLKGRVESGTPINRITTVIRMPVLSPLYALESFSRGPDGS